MSQEHPTGVYEVINNDGLFIRREPRIVDTVKATNKVGKYPFGTTFRVYDTTTDKMNITWGRISESDAAGVAQWVCLDGLNRTYARCVDPDPDPVETLTARIVELEARVTALENGTTAVRTARTKKA